jgi:hypothetical protein
MTRKVLRRLFALVILAFAPLSCRTATASRGTDLRDAAAAALSMIERVQHIQPVVVVLADPVDQEIRSALCQLRRCVGPNDVPVSDLYSLPAGYLLFRELTLRGNEGTFAGTLGPSERSRPDREILKCGTHYRIDLGHQPNGRWVTGLYEAGEC